jgi:NAD(P)-dependent dehydrogenase (short-subunit alcohol dehydrogenase family)
MQTTVCIERIAMSASRKRSVVVTGASSGIGKATVLRLATNGWRVFAAVRRQQDAESLRSQSGDGVETVQLDVADEGSIRAAAEEVSSRLGNDGLDGLFNNAGIGTVSPIEYTTVDSIRRIYEVNLFGQISVIQAFLPLLRRAKGRIVNTGSVVDHLSPPFVGVLASSKAAFASVSSSLRLELRAQGIYIIVVEPGSINTAAVEKTLGGVETKITSLPPEGVRLYAAGLRRMAAAFAKNEKTGSSPDVVAQVVEKALNAKKPRTRYPAGKDSIMLITLARLLPEKLLDVAIMKAFGLSTKFGQAVE